MKNWSFYNITEEEWESISNPNPPTKCPKCRKTNCTISDVGDGTDYRISCPDCKFTKCYDGIDS